MTEIPALAQYGLAGVAIGQLMLIWFLINRIMDVMAVNTKSVSDLMVSNTAALESLRVLFEERTRSQ